MIALSTTADSSTHSGRRPRRLTVSRVALYLVLLMALVYFLIPTYVMIVTALKPIEEVRLGSMLALPQEPTFEPFLKAWFTACTGANCTGMQVGFWNSVKMTVPTIVVMIMLGILNGYVLSFWRVKWANIFLAGTVVATFLPYQVMIYPLIRVMSAIGIHGTILAAVIVHTVYHMPVLTLIFRNYFVGLPIEMFKAARIDGAGFWRVLFSVILPMSLPIVIVAVILAVTWVWNDFLIGLTFAGQRNFPMMVQVNNIIGSDTAEKAYNVEMAAIFLTSIVPLAVYFLAGRWFVRGITAGAVKG